MTAPIPTSIVTVEHWDNVTQITWHPVEPPQPPLLTRPAPGMSLGEEGTSARRRALAHLGVCWRRSQLRTDLADAGAAIGFALAVVFCVAIWPDEISRLVYTLLGGAR
jgi:hypothetical protein